MNVIFEKIIKELLTLANMKPLSKSNLAQVKTLMKELRQMGYTNREVSELIAGGWKVSTVKTYTRGTIIKNPDSKENAVKLLSQMVDMGLSLNDVESAIKMKEVLGQRGITFESVSSLLEAAKKSKVGVIELVQTHNDLTDSGISITLLNEALSYKSELEEIGFTIDNLAQILKTSKTYGDHDRVLEAITAYGSQKTIETEIRNISSDKAKLEKQVTELKSGVKELEERKILVEGTLKIYENLRGLGFDEAILKQLKDSSNRYLGVKGVLEAVNKYNDLATLKSEVDKFEKNKINVTSELKSFQAEHAHYQTVLDICDTLLYKLNFSVPAIIDIYKTAKKYGEPIEVINAIEKYGTLRVLDKNIAELSSKKGELESIISELTQQAKELRALSRELKKTYRNLLTPFANDLRKNAVMLRTQFSKASDTITTKYEEYAEKLGELYADAGRLEEELRLARVLQALIKYPSEAKEIPLDYDVLMLRGIRNHCFIKDVNPEVIPGDTISRNNVGIYSGSQVKLLDLFDWAMIGLANSLAS